MLEKTRGIFLNQIRYSDSANIAHIYTEHFGRLSIFIRRSKSNWNASKKNILQPLFLFDLQINVKHKREIQNVGELNISPAHNSIPFNVVKSSIAIFIAELLTKVLKEEEANPGLFNYLYNSIQFLDHMEAGTSNYHLVFLYELTKYLGFYPSENYTEVDCFFNLKEGCYTARQEAPGITLDKSLSLNFRTLKIKGFKSIHDIQFSRQDRQRLLDSILDYYNFHMPTMGHLKSLQVFNDLFSF